MSEFDVERDESRSSAGGRWSGSARRYREDGLVSIPAVVVTYDPQWPRQFERLRGQCARCQAGTTHGDLDRDA
jgi:hypothetical protein